MKAVQEHIIQKKQVKFLYVSDDTTKPTFVSLVKYGANGTPFSVVKREKHNNNNGNIQEDDCMSMKVLQAIVTKSGVGVDDVRAAFPEVKEAVKLSEPKPSGGFVVYEQVPRESFKSESLEVVALNDEQSMFGIQGELASQPEGFVAKLLKPAQKREYIGMADSDGAIPVEALKSRLGNQLWEEMDALRDLIRGTLNQEAGSGEEKIAIIKTGMDNFLKSIETATVLFKCEKFELPVPKETEAALDKAGKDDKVTEMEKAEQVKNKSEPEKKEDTQKGESFAEALEKSESSMKALLAESMVEVLKSVKGELGTFREELEKSLKTPLTVVPSHEDDPIELEKKEKEKGKGGNVFKGCFGKIG
jgi:hypothetical protein